MDSQSLDFDVLCVFSLVHLVLLRYDVQKKSRTLTTWTNEESISINIYHTIYTSPPTGVG